MDGTDGGSTVFVSLLGGLSLSCEGERLELPASRKTRALFAFLLLDQRTHRRERLCEIFFDIPDDPRAALCWSLSKIRSTLGACADALHGDRETVRLDARRFTLDIERLRGPPSEAELPLAMERPLVGIEWSGSDYYDAWLAAERGRIDALRLAWLRWAADEPGIPDTERARYRQEALDIAEELGGRDEPRAPRPVSQQIQYCLAADGVRIAYAVTGEGPPLVKAANWLNHLELDWASPLWGTLIEGLSRSHCFVRYDERGNGMSQWEVDEISFDTFVMDLETVVDRVGLERFPLIGISQGCAVSIEYAARHPERVSKLILIGGYAAGWRHYGDEAEIARREAAMTLVRHGWGQDNPVYRQLFSQTFFPRATPEELDWFNDFQRRTASPENAVRLLEAFSHIDVRPRLKQVRAPTLVIHSQNDNRIPLAQGVELAATIPGASMVTLDSDSHIPLNREPAMKRLSDAVMAFLRER